MAKEPRLSIRYKEQELTLYKKLVQLMGVEDISTALRLLAREKLESYGVEIPEGSFEKRSEGRPKEGRRETLSSVQAAA